MADYADRAAANDRSLNQASSHRNLWSEEEEDLIRETMEEPLEDVAYVLGRSIFATDMRRSIVRHGGAVARANWDRLAPLARAARTPMTGTEERPACPSCFLVHAPGQRGCE